jgi:folate-dependent phosphoribosylglycinamide formyltransferase PurN
MVARSVLRSVRDSGAWRPSHAKLLLDQVVDRDRDAGAGWGDANRLWAAAEWLERAQDATGNGGVAGRYRLKSGWTAAYPETTGYIIPTFLALADERGRAHFRDRAARSVEFLLRQQLPGGAFPGGELRDAVRDPSFFNTAQIVSGLVAWHRVTGDQRSLDAACQAADWLLTLQDGDGAFRRHLYFNVVTTYGLHASCWLAELGAYTGDRRYLEAAHRHLSWALTYRDKTTGWIDRCGFSEDDHRARRSVTHTIGYTLAGALATARLVGDTDAIAAVTDAALAAARRLELSGYLPGVLDHRWRPASRYSCLTGNAQMALVWLTLFDETRDTRLLNAALKAIDLVKSAQPMTTSRAGIRGGVPGSDPIWGSYIRMAVPNWSAKFFIDALLKKREVMSALPARARGLAAPSAGVPRALPAAETPARHQPVRIVVLATPTSKKAVHMIRTRNWELRPAAVAILTRPRTAVWRRLSERVERDGLRFLLRRRAATSPPGPAGNAGRVDVRAACREAGIAALELDSFESPEALGALARLHPDLFVFAGGPILRAALLSIPRLGTVNAHMGLLPFYRGMNVAEWARFHGDTVGCSVHLMDPGIDTGDILCTRPVETTGVRTVAELRHKVGEAQLDLLRDTVRYVARTGALPPRRWQSVDEGRQFFSMHPELLELLERELESSAASGRA